MGEEADTLILRFLRRLDTKLDEVKQELGEVVIRLGRVEEGLARLRRDRADDAEVVAHIQVRLDRMDSKIDRINRRLDLEPLTP